MPQVEQHTRAQILLAYQRDPIVKPYELRWQLDRISRDQDHDRAPPAFYQDGRCLESIQAWHAYVQQHDIRSDGGYGSDRVLAARSLADVSEARSGTDEIAECLANARLIIGAKTVTGRCSQSLEVPGSGCGAIELVTSES